MLTALGNALADDGVGFVRCRLGADASILRGVEAEGERAWPRMRPGELRASDGAVIVGRSPSGALRGDRHVRLRELAEGPDGWPHLFAADAAMGAIGAAVRVACAPQRVRIGVRSDAFVARFPGDDGLGYGNHLDGDEWTRVTAILYTSTGWCAEHGGELHLLDEQAQCWWSVPPVADTLVLFRADRFLHRVMPCAGGMPRVALTVWLSEDRMAEAERQALVSNLGGFV